ncbi:MAG: hypothetical protein JNL42_23330 [Anaerolineae bacterium]|nr:hypothetical protein [Anaerolineae bacterium]
MMPGDALPQQKRARWWAAQQNTFGLPKSLYAPLPFAVVTVIGLGAGGGFLGLVPGVNTLEATLSGVGAPWIGLAVVGLVAGLWYWRALRHAYAAVWMVAMTGLAGGIAVLVSTLVLDVLVVELPDAVIGGLGLAFLFVPLLLALSLLLDGFVLSVYVSTFMGGFIGGMAGFPIDFGVLLLFIFVYAPIGALVGGIGGILRPLIRRLLRR